MYQSSNYVWVNTLGTNKGPKRQVALTSQVLLCPNLQGKLSHYLSESSTRSSLKGVSSIMSKPSGSRAYRCPDQTAAAIVPGA